MAMDESFETVSIQSHQRQLKQNRQKIMEDSMSSPRTVTIDWPPCQKYYDSKKKKMPKMLPNAKIALPIFSMQEDDDAASFSSTDMTLPDSSSSLCIVTRPEKVAITSNKKKRFENPIPGILEFFHERYLIWSKQRTIRLLENHINILHQIKVDCDVKNFSERAKRRLEMEQLGGLIAVALFLPLEGTYNDSNAHHQKEEKDLHEAQNDDVYSEEDDNMNIITMAIEEEDPEVLSENPRIITSSMMQQIAQNLPMSVQLKRWTRLFSASRDGDYFPTFLNKVKNHSHTVIVVQTTSNDIFGGYSASPWNSKSTRNNIFYGSGASFVFQVAEEVDIHDKLNNREISCYPWTRENDFFQLRDISGERIAMGGGGVGSNFGFCVENYFTRGSTGACETYGNPPLAKSAYFDILAFEVYGFDFYL